MPTSTLPITLFFVLVFVPIGSSAQEWTPDFLQLMVRFGIECDKAGPQIQYTGDVDRFAVVVQTPTAAPASDRPAASDRTAYRVFYRDLLEPDATGSTLVLRCRGETKCIAQYKGASVQSFATLRLAGCDARRAQVAATAAKHLVLRSF